MINIIYLYFAIFILMGLRFFNFESYIIIQRPDTLNIVNGYNSEDKGYKLKIFLLIVQVLSTLIINILEMIAFVGLLIVKFNLRNIIFSIIFLSISMYSSKILSENKKNLDTVDKYIKISAVIDLFKITGSICYMMYIISFR